jgi:hypothetical protein
MPELSFTDQHLVVKLSRWEQVAMLRKSFLVPWNQVRGATEDFGAIPAELGIRAPGTGFPGAIAAGTYYKRFAKQFVAWYKGQIPVVVELKGHKFARLILGSSDPKTLVREINSRAQAS